MKEMGMLIVWLRGVTFRFLSHSGCSEKNAITGCPKSSFLYFISLYFSTIGLGKKII